jgi:hypothetical protein
MASCLVKYTDNFTGLPQLKDAVWESPGRFTSGTHWIRGWGGGPRADVDAMAKAKKSLPGVELRSSSIYEQLLEINTGRKLS